MRLWDNTVTVCCNFSAIKTLLKVSEEDFVAPVFRDALAAVLVLVILHSTGGGTEDVASVVSAKFTQARWALAPYNLGVRIAIAANSGLFQHPVLRAARVFNGAVAREREGAVVTCLNRQEEGEFLRVVEIRIFSGVVK